MKDLGLAEAALAHKEHEAQPHKKHIKEVRVRHGHKGGYIAEHHHHMPEVHPMEEHVIPDQDGLADHMLEHMGSPNPGEADADAGMSGVPQGEV